MTSTDGKDMFSKSAESNSTSSGSILMRAGLTITGAAQNDSSDDEA